MDSKEDEDDYVTTQSIASTCIDTFGDRFKNMCAEVVDVADELLTTIANTPDAIYELSLMYSSQVEIHDNDEDLASQDLSQSKVKVEDLSLGEIKSEGLDSKESSQIKTKIEDPISQISSQVNSKIANLVSQDLRQVKVKVEDSIYEDMSLGEIKSDGLGSQESSQVKTKIEDPISQISSQVNGKTENLVSQDSNSNSTIMTTDDIENLNSYEWSSDGHGDDKLRDNNDVNSSYSSQNESSFYSSSFSQFQDDSFDYSGNIASSSSTLVKSFDRDFFWVTKDLDHNAYEVCNAAAITSIHKKELNMISKLKSLKIDNDKIDMGTRSTHLEDNWGKNLIHGGELESLALKKSNKKANYKKKMKSVLTSPKFLISKMKSSSVNGVEQINPRHHQIPLSIKECSIDFDWEVL